MMILYFTATGNGLYIAKTIGGERISIPKAIKNGNFSFKDDKIGIVFPIYGLAVPQYIKEFLQKVKFDSKYIFAVMSYGMIDGGAVDDLRAVAAESNIHFSYINTIRTVDNYIPGFDMKKQIETESKKQIDKHLASIVDDIKSGKQWIRKSTCIGKLITKMLSGSDKFKTGAGITNTCSVEDTCTKCGTCVKVCPVDNIKLESSKPVFATKCMSCLACTQNCPQNAIRLSNEKSKVRFRNQNVSLKEIIESNG